MLLLKALLPLILVSLTAADASPLSRTFSKAALSFATRINLDGSLNIAERDRARAQALKNSGQLGKRSISFSVTNAAVYYTAQIGVGSPATEYTLLIDTGSANTWVGASKPYTKTRTSEDTGNTVSVPYGHGSFNGEEWIDTVTIAPGLIIKEQSIGVASSTLGFSDVDGILGIGPVDLTSGTVGNTSTVPTVLDNLVSQGTISEEVVGIYYVPVSELSGEGTLTFGGVDESVITSSVDYVLLTTTSPASNYWGIEQSVTYDGKTILSTTAGVVDTGTTFILIASDAFKKYQSATGDKSYDISPNAQIWPRSLNTAIGGSSTSIYLIVNDIGYPSGSGLDFINGYVFLERYYGVLDTTNKRVGFATTAYTEAITN